MAWQRIGSVNAGGQCLTLAFDPEAKAFALAENQTMLDATQLQRLLAAGVVTFDNPAFQPAVEAFAAQGAQPTAQPVAAPQPVAVTPQPQFQPSPAISPAAEALAAPETAPAKRAGFSLPKLASPKAAAEGFLAKLQSGDKKALAVLLVACGLVLALALGGGFLAVRGALGDADSGKSGKESTATVEPAAKDGAEKKAPAADEKAPSEKK